jgi:hypothetical protein
MQSLHMQGHNANKGFCLSHRQQTAIRVAHNAKQRAGGLFRIHHSTTFRTLPARLIMAARSAINVVRSKR